MQKSPGGLAIFHRGFST